MSFETENVNIIKINPKVNKYSVHDFELSLMNLICVQMHGQDYIPDVFWG